MSRFGPRGNGAQDLPLRRHRSRARRDDHPHHATAEQAGDVRAKIKLKLAVYSHITRPAATEQDVFAPTGKTYGGLFELGEDLMVIEMGESVTASRPAAALPRAMAQSDRPRQCGAGIVGFEAAVTSEASRQPPPSTR